MSRLGCLGTFANLANTTFVVLDLRPAADNDRSGVSWLVKRAASRERDIACQSQVGLGQRFRSDVTSQSIGYLVPNRLFALEHLGEGHAEILSALDFRAISVL